MGGGGGLNLPNFQKKGASQYFNIERSASGKEEGKFFQEGGLQFYKENKLKSGIFNDEKKFLSKNIFLCHS